MANYNGFTRSDDFLVTDREKAEKILSSIICDGDFYYDICPRENTDYFRCWFGAYGNIYGLHPNYANNESEDDYDCDEEDYDLMITELQSILKEGEAITIFDVGHEKLRYVGGGVLVITKEDSKYVSLLREAEKLAKQMLNK